MLKLCKRYKYLVFLDFNGIWQYIDILCVQKEVQIWLLMLPLANVDRFLKFFHWHDYNWIADRYVANFLLDLMHVDTKLLCITTCTMFGSVSHSCHKVIYGELHHLNVKPNNSVVKWHYIMKLCSVIENLCSFMQTLFHRILFQICKFAAWYLGVHFFPNTV